MARVELTSKRPEMKFPANANYPDLSDFSRLANESPSSRDRKRFSRIIAKERVTKTTTSLQLFGSPALFFRANSACAQELRICCSR